jgi:hypothetical protein
MRSRIRLSIPLNLQDQLGIRVAGSGVNRTVDGMYKHEGVYYGRVEVMNKTIILKSWDKEAWTVAITKTLKENNSDYSRAS